MKNIIETNIDEFMSKATSMILPSNVLVDIGCGIRPHAYTHHNIYIACEPFKQYVKVLKENRENLNQLVYLDSCFIILNEDWESYLDKFERYSVDTIYLIDVIEHLTKEEGKKLLERTEKIARKQIVIFTPLEFIEQKKLPGNKDAWGLDGADFQEHKSVWTPDDFNGEEWIFVLCRDFHRWNNIGEKLEKPVGAFWAIKNCINQEKKEDILDNNEIYNKFISESSKSLINKKIYMQDSIEKKEEVICLKRSLDEKINNISKLKEINENCERENKLLTHKKEELVYELNEIKKSKSFRLIKKYWKLKDLIRRLF